MEFKSIMPIITFCLGILAIPIIESIKNRTKAKSILKNFILDIKDEYELLPSKIRHMHDTLKNLEKITRNDNNLNGSLKFIPRNINFYFLKDTFENSFQLFPKNKRFILKSIQEQLESLTNNRKVIRNTELSDNTLDNLIKEYKRYIFTSASLSYCIRYIIDKDTKININNISDKEIVAEEFKNLDLDIKLEDIRINNKYKFNYK